MLDRWIWITAAVIVDGCAGLVGGLIRDVWLERRRSGLIGFAAGALLAAALLDVLPEALRSRGPQALWWALGAFVVGALFEWSLSAHVHRRGGTPAAAAPLTLLASDALHNVGDGIAIAAAFLVSIPVGVVTSLAVIVHEVPEELGDYALLRASGMKKRTALVALGGVQLTAAVGAFGTLVAATRTAELSGIALAISTGMFLFIATADLLPEVLRTAVRGRARVEAVLGFLLGVGVVALQAGFGP
ncbi:MAG TPA: ZIP family metal transporter [Kofleriaceae bacterium]|nr:ZIP family metal transporter [Kofleriaceae bacterium]